MTDVCAAAIIAGGSSKRLGEDKALLKVGKQVLLERIYTELFQIIPQIRVIGPVRHSLKIHPEYFVADLIDGLGPLGGVYTALNIFNIPVLVVPCDLPNIRAEHIRILLSNFSGGGNQAVVARGTKGIEPLFAIYTQQCRKIIRSAIKKGDYALYKLIERLNVGFVDFTTEDKNSDLFFNINTLSDYKKALYLKKHTQI